jgi:hypothetical protein
MTTTVVAAMIATMAVAPAAAVAAVLPAVAAAQLEAEAARDRAADRAAAVGPRVAAKRTPSRTTLERPGKTPLEKKCSPEQERMTLFGGSFHLSESKHLVAISRAERSILVIRRAKFVYTR